MPRGIPAAILNALNSDVINDGFFYVVDIAFRSGLRFWDKRGIQIPAGSGNAQAGSLSTVTLPVGSTAVDGFYVGYSVQILSGTGAGQETLITGYVGSTAVATVSPSWGTAPDATSVVLILRNYQPRIASISDIAYLAGDQREVRFTVSNADGSLTTISQSESTYGCQVTIRRWVPAANASHIVWIGFLEELTEVGVGDCTLTAYADVPGANSHIPRRKIDVTCPQEFGSAPVNSLWQSTVLFDGAECGYGRLQNTNTTATVGSTSMIGFYGALSGNVAPTDSQIVVVITSPMQAAGMAFIVSDRLRIGGGAEQLEVTGIISVSLDSLTWTLAVERAVLGGDPASYTDNSTVFFANCQKSPQACLRRGNYGNNPNDTWTDPGDTFFAAHPSLGKSTDGGTVAVARLANRYGGVPIVTGYEFNKFQAKSDARPTFQTVSFASNQSSYGAVLPLVYGRVRLANPQLLCAMAQGTFLSALFALCEGPLATNPNDALNSEFMYLDGSGNPTADPNVGGSPAVAQNPINPHYQYNAFCADPSPPPNWAATPTNPYAERYLRVNGALRHDPRPGFGVQLAIGLQQQLEPIYSFLPNVQDFEGIFPGIPTGPGSATTLGNRLGLWGTVWVCLKIDTTNNPSIDINGSSINGTFGIQYGRIVRIYSSLTAFVEQATTNDAWVILDVMASRRAGGGIPYGQINLQSFLDHAAYCSQPVLNVAIADGVTTSPRFTFNGVIDADKTYDEWMAKLCMGCSATRPFIDAQGLYNIRTLRAMTPAELAAAPLFSDIDAGGARNILWDNGQTTLKKFRRRRKDQVPNRIRANFVNAAATSGYQAGEFVGLFSETITLLGGTGLFTPGVSKVAIGGQGSYLVTAQVTSGNTVTQITVSPAITGFQAGDGNGTQASSATHIHRQPVTDLSDFQKIQIVIDDEPSQTLVPGGIRNIVEKEIDLVGCTTLDQAIRRATLVLRIGEFGEGGLANNEGIRWSSASKGSSDCAIGDVVPVESTLLDPIEERYWRITDINDTAVTLPSGAQVFRRDFEAMAHDNGFFDDTGFTVTSVIPINPGSALNATPAAVTAFSAADQGVVDQNGTLMTNLTFTYTLPTVGMELIRSIVILRSSDDGFGNPAGDWRYVAELSTSPTTIPYPVSGVVEWFCAVSRPLTGHLPNTDTLNKDGSYTYPRVSVLIDGMADSPLGTPTGLGAFGEDNQIRLVWNAYTGTDAKTVKWFNVYRNTVNSSASATLIDKSATTWYLDTDPTLSANPTEIFYYWIRGVSKLDQSVINGVTQDGLSPFSAVASDNAGTDNAVPNAPVINALRDVTNVDGNFTYVIGVDQPRVSAPNGHGDTAPTNWDTVESLRIQIATDAGFSSVVFDHTFGFTLPPFVTEYEVQPNALGTYYFRALVTNIFGDSAYSSTLTRSTNYALDTDIMGAATGLAIVTRAGSNDLAGDEFEIDLTLPGSQDSSYFGVEYFINDTSTLPDPDYESTGTTGNNYSAYAPTGAAGTGNVTVGSNVLTDTGKAWPTSAGGLTGRRVLIFSIHRPTSGTWSQAGLVDIRTIQSNTATTLTLDRTVRLSGANIQYAILTSGGKMTLEKVKYSAVIPDYSQDASLVGPTRNGQRALRVSTNLTSGYVWVDCQNLWGSGVLASGSPVALTLSGITVADIKGDGSTPNAPTGLSNASAFRSNILEWTNAGNTDLVSTEIWRATTNNIASASLVATVPYPQETWADTNLTSGSTYYYWVRHVDKDGNHGPYNAAATAGTAGTTLNSTLLGGEIAAATILGLNIVAGTITSDKLTVASLDAVSSTLGTVTAGNISASTITGSTFRTSASNPRVQIDTTNGFTSTNSGGSTTFQVDTSGNVFATSMTAMSGVLFHIIGNGSGVTVANKNSATAYTELDDDGTYTVAWNNGKLLHLFNNANGSDMATVSSTDVKWGNLTAGFTISDTAGVAAPSHNTLYIQGDGGASANGTVTFSYCSSDAGATQIMQRKGRGTHASPSDVTAGDNLFTWGYNAYSGGWIGGTYALGKVSTNAFSSGQRPPLEIHWRTNNANGGMTDSIVMKQDQTVQMPAYGAGTATFDGSGNITSTSDERLKDILGSFTTGLEALMMLDPIRYRWNDRTEFNRQFEHVGFSAQQVQKVIPSAVGTNRDGYLSLDDRGLIAALVNAVKELNHKVDALSAA